MCGLRNLSLKNILKWEMILRPYCLLYGDCISTSYTHTRLLYFVQSLLKYKEKKKLLIWSHNLNSSHTYYCGKMCGNEGLWHTMKRSTVNSLIKGKIYVCMSDFYQESIESHSFRSVTGKDKRKIKQNKAFVTSNRWPLSCAHQLNIHRHFLH